MASKVPFITRNAIGDDLNFIYSTWLDSYRYDSALGKSHKNTIFFAEYRRILDSLLQKSQVVIAAVPESTETILGYIVYEPQILHYIYTKGPFRKFGIARELLSKTITFAPIIYTHETFTASAITNARSNEFIHNNFLLFKQGEINNG